MDISKSANQEIRVKDIRESVYQEKTKFT